MKAENCSAAQPPVLRCQGAESWVQIKLGDREGERRVKNMDWDGVNLRGLLYYQRFLGALRSVLTIANVVVNEFQR